MSMENVISKHVECEFYRENLIKSRYSLDNSEFNWSYVNKNKKKKVKHSLKSDTIYPESFEDKRYEIQ